MKTNLRHLLLALALTCCGAAAAQPPVLIHSHNDYAQRVPFYQAYAQQVSSIEADVFLHDGQLLVGHDVEDLRADMTFEALYVEPIVTLFIAAMAMQGILSNIDLFKNVLETGTETLSGDGISYRAVAKASLLFADALIAEERN